MSRWVDSSSRVASHLSDDARGELHALLVAQQRSNLEQAAAHEATARELAVHADADSIIERELAEVGAVRARDAAREAEEALGRLAAGTYGTCEVCGAPIPFERLEAIPQARHCVACLRPRLGGEVSLLRGGAAAGRS
jgi:RNA polymerase-binding transcription factor DksA